MITVKIVSNFHITKGRAWFFLKFIELSLGFQANYTNNSTHLDQDSLYNSCNSPEIRVIIEPGLKNMDDFKIVVFLMAILISLTAIAYTKKASFSIRIHF